MSEEMTNENQETAAAQNNSATLLTGDDPQSSQASKSTEPDASTSLAEEAGQTTEAAKPKQSPKSDIPETYDLKAPEGVELDAAFLEQATPLLKELKLSAPQAQKLADLYADKVAGIRQAQIDAWSKTTNGWQEAARNDAEYGGERLAENASLAKAALNRFGTDELKKDLEAYGMGNHPEFIRLLYRVGKAMETDSFVVGERAGGAVDPGKVLYPNMK